MASLYNQIMELYYKGAEWNYYNMDSVWPFDDVEARNFIKQYFENGAKKGVVLPMIDEIDSMRHLHSVSAFFLGLLIKRELCPDLTIYSKASEPYEFSYLWFLVCLFHDMGYAIENDWTYKYIYRQNTNEYLKQYKRPKRNSMMWKASYDDLGVIFVSPSVYRNEFCWASDRVKKDSCFNGIEFSNGVTIEGSRYSRRTVLDYLEYCKVTDGIRHYDHGIVGGLWLYDSLCKNYDRAYLREKEINEDVNCNDFIHDGLHFSKEQKKIFAYLSDCIIAHNMWPASFDRREEYERGGLFELIPPRFKKISFKNNPILFILALADTIEPIKLYLSVSGMREVDIWQGIDMNFSSEYVTIKLIDKQLPFESLVRKVCGLDNWLNVGVVTDSMEREVRIQFL